MVLLPGGMVGWLVGWFWKGGLMFDWMLDGLGMLCE